METLTTPSAINAFNVIMNEIQELKKLYKEDGFDINYDDMDELCIDYYADEQYVIVEIQLGIYFTLSVADENKINVFELQYHFQKKTYDDFYDVYEAREIAWDTPCL
tara:strand:+ start:37 stop:357 length:321 start_codon:yes stop_codon:yes gene_type:complete